MTTQRGLFGWLFQRITGAYLVFGIGLHIIVTHFTTRSVTFENVSERLHGGGWLLFDLSLLLVSFYHGFKGQWGIVLDFNPSAKKRQVGPPGGFSFLLLHGWYTAYLYLYRSQRRGLAREVAERFLFEQA